MEKEFCCSEFYNNTNDKFDIDATTKEVNVWGCCGGGCYVLTNLKYCPYCGKEIVFK